MFLRRVGYVWGVCWDGFVRGGFVVGLDLFAKGFVVGMVLSEEVCCKGGVVVGVGLLLVWVD